MVDWVAMCCNVLCPNCARLYEYERCVQVSLALSAVITVVGILALTHMIAMPTALGATMTAVGGLWFISVALNSCCKEKKWSPPRADSVPVTPQAKATPVKKQKAKAGPRKFQPPGTFTKDRFAQAAAFGRAGSAIEGMMNTPMRPLKIDEVDEE